MIPLEKAATLVPGPSRNQVPILIVKLCYSKRYGTVPVLIYTVGITWQFVEIKFPFYPVFSFQPVIGATPSTAEEHHPGLHGAQVPAGAAGHLPALRHPHLPPPQAAQ